MSPRVERHKAELEKYRLAKAYYALIRRPWLERTTFTRALLAALAVSLRRFGIGIISYEREGSWMYLFYGVSLVLFLGFDSLLTKAHYSVPMPLGGFNPSRIFEKFTFQGRTWQLLLVLMLWPTARLIFALRAFILTH